MALAYVVLCGVLFSAISAGHGGVVEKFFFGSGEYCSSDQSESIYDCLHLMADELTMLSPEAKEIVNLTGILFEQNQFNPFSQGKQNKAESSSLFGSQSSLEPGPGQMNRTEIARILRSQRNQTMELIQAACLGMEKFVSCSDEAIQDNECRPLMYRGVKVSSEIFCDEEFQETLIPLTVCLLETVHDPRLGQCLLPFSQTFRTTIMDAMLGDEKSFGDAMCRMSAIVLECFRPMLDECDNQVFEQYVRMTNTAISAMFETECGTNSTYSDKFGDKIAMDREENVEKDSGSIVVDESFQTSKSAQDSKETLVEKKTTLIGDANEKVAVAPVKVDDETDDI